jgi:plastocyanin
MQAAAGHHLGTRAKVAILGGIVGVAALLVLAVGDGPTASAAGGATASRSVTVKLNHNKFIPRAIEIAKGTTVVWSNVSKTKHTAQKGGSFNTGTIKPGRAAAVKFTAPGTYRYFCAFHEKMKGKIVVG